MDRIRTVATFVAGVLVGGGAVYFSPPEGSDALTTGAGMPTSDMAHPVDGGLLPDGSKPPLPPLDGTSAASGVATQGGTGQPGMMTGAGTAAGAPPGGTTPGMPPVPGEATSGVPPQGSAGTPGMPANPPVAAGLADPAGAVAVPGEGTPDGAQTGNGTPTGPPPPYGNRLEKHLQNAPTLWTNALHAAQKASDPAGRALAADVQDQIDAIPQVAERMPPMQDVAIYLASSRILLDRLATSGIDVTELSLQIDVLMRPPRGKIQGGPRSDAGQPH